MRYSGRYKSSFFSPTSYEGPLPIIHRFVEQTQKMPYCKAWREAMYLDFKADGAYIDYKTTKDILHRMKEDLSNPSTPEELYASLIDQKKLAFEWCKKKVAQLLSLAQILATKSERFSESSGKDVSPQIPSPQSAQTTGNAFEILAGKDFTVQLLSAVELEKYCDAVLHELLRFQETRNLNTDTIDHIVTRQFRLTALGPSGKWLNIHSEYDFYSFALDEIFYLLSVAYERIKANRLSTSKVPTGAVGSQVFDRRSVKYWVHKQDLPFVIARIIRHLPLSTMKDIYKESKEHHYTFCLGQSISSVYYDNRYFLYYHRRLERLEGSSLIRLRWYTDNLVKDTNKTPPDSDVFVEMKVHHEAWSGERSTKRRFALKERDVDSYLRGTLSLEPAVEKLKAKQTSEKEIEKFKSLAAEVLRKVKAYDLKPVLRTSCVRSAFQRGQDQSVRVSIDTDLKMSAEDFGLGHHWRFTANDDLGTTYFPYAVVEIKLQCAENERIAPWIEELMGCRYMESVPKFSKYSHGIASLFGHTPAIKMVPYWLHQMDNDIRASLKPENKIWDPTLGLSTTWAERLADQLIFGIGNEQTQRVGASQAQFLPSQHHQRRFQQLIGVTRPTTQTTYPLDIRHDAYTKFHLYPYTEGGIEAICFSGPETRGSAAKVLTGTIPWQTGKRIRVPQKYDPKTLLTSERYMVKWVQKSSVLGLTGVGVIRFANSGVFLIDTAKPIWGRGLNIVIGICLVITSVLVSFYALFTFRARARRVYARRKIRYDDVRGPSVLTGIIIIFFLVVLANNIMVRFGPMLMNSATL